METDTIDLLKLLRLFRRKFWIILLSTVMGLLISGSFTIFYIQKQYSANVLLYIWQEKTENQANPLTINDLNLFTQLVNDYQVLVKSRLVTQKVAEQLQLDPASAIVMSFNGVVIRSKSSRSNMTLEDLPCQKLLSPGSFSIRSI